MTTQILAAIGETELQPVASLAAALGANDRLKYVFSRLQMALAHADHPQDAPATLKRERVAYGIDDSELNAVAAGILTASGGRTSHAAVVARQLGKVCLVACPELTIDLEHRRCRVGGTVVNEGEFLSLDGNTGAVYAGQLRPLTERPDRALAAIAAWRRAVAS